MRNLIALFILALVYLGCTNRDVEENDGTFHLTGEISGNYNEWVYLLYDDVRDSSRVEKGQFSFTGELERPVQASIILQGTSNLNRVYLDSGKVRLTADYQLQGKELNTVNTLQNVVITGSASQDLYTDMQARYLKYWKADSSGQRVYEYMAHLIDSTSSHPAIGTQLASAAISPDVLTNDQLYSLYTQFDTSNMDALAKQVFALGMANRSSYKIGDAFPDLPIERPDGTQTSLSELRGMQLYVDFWASWCGPCRENHPRLSEIAAEVAGTSMAVVSISIDKDRDKWLHAAQQDAINWSSYWDGEHRLEKDMAITAIPKSYLLDENGIILKIDPKLEEYRQWAGLQ